MVLTRYNRLGHTWNPGTRVNFASPTDNKSFPTRIPVEKEGEAVFSGLPSRGRCWLNMEQQMDRDEEQVLRSWDENFTRKERETFRVRPLGLRSRVGSGRSSTPHREEKGKFLSVERVLERDASFDDGDAIFDTSAESLDDDLKKPMYTTCPLTGRRLFRMQLDVQGFEADDIKVKVSGHKLLVFARHKENESGRRSTTEFCKKLKLPEDVEVDRLECQFRDTGLLLEAPVHQRAAGVSHSSPSLPRKYPQQLNVPSFRVNDTGKALYLQVEVGRVFQAGDVVVKLKGKDRLIVSAQRKEDDGQSSLDASVTREFTLAEEICPKSLKAGLNTEGVLTVQAQALPAEGHTNGLAVNRPRDHVR